MGVPSLPPTRLAATALLTALLTALAACNNATPRGEQAYCENLSTNSELLLAPVTQPATVAPLLARYHRLDELAPEAVRDEWHELVTLIEKVANADPRKPQTQAEMTVQAHATDQSIQHIVSHARRVCGVELGPAQPKP